MTQVTQIPGFLGDVGKIAVGADLASITDRALFLNGSQPTGVSDTTSGILSMWIEVDDVDAGAVRYFQVGNPSAPNFDVVEQNGDLAWKIGNGSSLTSTFPNGTIVLAEPAIYHILLAWDLDAGVAQAYLNDSLTGFSISIGPVAGDVDWTDTRWSVGTGTAGGDPMSGCISEIYLTIAGTLDMTSTANRRLFSTFDGFPQDLKSDGSGPTGSIPLLYFRGEGLAINVNSGSGGNFGVDAAIVDCDHLWKHEGR
ncbi:MAG: hypothetical protein V3W09_04110 [Nitrososphaerales archaeon]